MVKKRKSDTEERDSPDPDREEPAKKHRKSSVAVTGKEALANLKRYDLEEVLAAIGFIAEAGEVFEKLAKNWYARHRPARILTIGDVDKAGGQFNYMIVDFIIEYGDAFWSKEARGHLVNKGSNAYRPTNWRKGENISFSYPRDSVHRLKGVRNFTVKIQTEERIDSHIFTALKPYFAGLHFHGRAPNEDKDPDDFEDWSLSDAELAECLHEHDVMSKQTPWKRTSPKTTSPKNTSPRAREKRKSSTSTSAGSSPAPIIYKPPESEAGANVSSEPVGVKEEREKLRRTSVPAGSTVVPDSPRHDEHRYQASKYTGDTSALINMARLRGIKILPTISKEEVKTFLENFDVAWNSSTSEAAPTQTDYEKLYIGTLREIIQERGLQGWATTRKSVLIAYLEEFDRTRAQRVAPADSETTQDRVQLLVEPTHSTQSEVSTDEPITVTVKREDSPLAMPMPTGNIKVEERQDSPMPAPTPPPPNFGYGYGYGFGSGSCYGATYTFGNTPLPLRPANPYTRHQMTGNVPYGTVYQSSIGLPNQYSILQNGSVARPSFMGGMQPPCSSFMGGGIPIWNPGAARRSLIPSYVKAGNWTSIGQGSDALGSIGNPIPTFETSSTFNPENSATPRRSLIPMYVKADHPTTIDQNRQAIDSTIETDNSTNIDQNSEAINSTPNENNPSTMTHNSTAIDTEIIDRKDSESTTSTLTLETFSPPSCENATTLQPSSPQEPSTSLHVFKSPPLTAQLLPHTFPTAPMREEISWTEKMNRIEAEAEEARQKSKSLGKGVVREDGRWEWPESSSTSLSTGGGGGVGVGVGVGVVE